MTDGSPANARRSSAPPPALGDAARLRALHDTGLDAVPDGVNALAADMYVENGRR